MQAGAWLTAASAAVISSWSRATRRLPRRGTAVHRAPQRRTEKKNEEIKREARREVRIITPPWRGLADTPGRKRGDASSGDALVDAGRRQEGSGALVLRRYEALVESGVLRPDARQQRLVKMLSLTLSGLVDGLAAHKLSPHDPASPGADAARKVKGLYVYGEVGSGKSMAMNLFSEAAKELLPAGAVRRVHFHEFMLKVHADLHTYKATSERGSPRAIPAVAESTSRETRVLCLDEFQVTDIADAAIIAQLLEGIWRAGVCVVATSNRAPTQLYQAGLNRHVYLPKFEKLLIKYCKVMNLTEQETKEHAATPVVDYRLGGQQVSYLYTIAPPAPPAPSPGAGDMPMRLKMLRTWELLMGLEGAQEGAQEGVGGGRAAAAWGGRAGEGREDVFGERGTAVGIGFGRHVTAEMTVERGGVRAVWFTADALFEGSLGPVDYLLVARRYDVVLVQGLAPFDLRTHNQARRFMSFIDILYDEGCLLVLGASCPATELLRLVEDRSGGQELGEQVAPGRGDTSEVTITVKKEGGSSSSGSTTYINDTEWSSTGRIGVSMAALSGVKDVEFSRARAESRLLEMQTAGYLATRPRCAQYLRLLLSASSLNQ